jgi:hypothetical protein
MKEKHNVPTVLYLKTCDDVTEHKNNTKQEWISEKIWVNYPKGKKLKEGCVSKTRKQKAVLQAEHLNVVKEVKKGVQRDYKRWVYNVVKKAEHAAQNKENVELYKITTTLSNKRWRITDRMGGTSITVT